jgi:hypothetical protein
MIGEGFPSSLSLSRLNHWTRRGASAGGDHVYPLRLAVAGGSAFVGGWPASHSHDGDSHSAGAICGSGRPLLIPLYNSHVLTIKPYFLLPLPRLYNSRVFSLAVRINGLMPSFIYPSLFSNIRMIFNNMKTKNTMRNTTYYLAALQRKSISLMV